MQAADLDSIRPLQRVVAAGSGLVINVGATEVLKHTVHELRPDRTDNHSFPSRHSSWAFALSSAISNQLGDQSPWWSVGAYAAASAIGYQRVFAGRHYTSDVIAGAGIGVASAEIGNLIARAIFRRHYSWGAPAEFRPTFGVVSGVIWPLQEFHYQHLHAIFTSGVRGTLPLSDHWGASATIACATARTTDFDRYNMVSASLGAFYRLQLNRELAFEPEIALGYGHLTENFPFASCNRFIFSATAALDYRLTSRWSTALRAGYTHAPVAALTVAVASTVVF